MNWSWEKDSVSSAHLSDDSERYENALKVLRECQNSMQVEIGSEDLSQSERESKIMLIELCKEIAFEFAEGIEPSK